MNLARLFILGLALVYGFPTAARPLLFACSPDNDLFRVTSENGLATRRFNTPQAAVEAAATGDGVLVLADGYPAKTTALDSTLFEQAAAKRLRLFVEYPSFLPGVEVGAPQSTRWERAVITSDAFAPELTQRRILAIHGCQFLPIKAEHPDIVLGRVAGFDTAVFGPAKESHPVLCKLPAAKESGEIWVATTKLSHFVTGRYMPGDAWRAVWTTLLSQLQPGQPPPSVRWTPTVRPSFAPAEPLPADAELQALRRSADWIIRSRVLRHSAWPAEVQAWSLHYNTVRDQPLFEWSAGDGSFGLLEGFSSNVRPDGSQPMRYAVRNDCTFETAMLMAFDAACQPRPASASIATNLIDYVLHRSGLAGGPRADPRQSSYGLLGWALDTPGGYWGDDNARALLGLAATSALVGDTRWDDALLRCLLANFRTTGRSGFREACLTEQSLATRGWQAYWNASPVQYSPHFQGWLWACFFWAYDQTHFDPLLARSEKGLRQMMMAYPRNWEWVVRSGTIERARALLPLAWLVRVADTPEHRQWLRRVAEDLIALQDASGALREIIGDGGSGTASNEEFGTRETSLIQTNGDPVCDLLYACNFALIGLHEAAAATGDPFYAQAEDRLARFLCRIQIRSEAHPELDGAWYRAFDFQRWEYWASSADWEWGPWCTETGWTQPWIASTLGLRQRKTCLWDLLKSKQVQATFARLRPQMLPDAALAKPSVQARHTALDKRVDLGTTFAPQYAAGGLDGLTDGRIAQPDYQDPAWQGFHGVDLIATIDLGETQPIHQIQARFLRQISVGIFLPTNVEVALSQNGRDFHTLARLKPSVPERVPGPLIHVLEAGGQGQSARFVRVRASNVRSIPAWHPSAPGQAAWLFCDEILVNPEAKHAQVSSARPLMSLTLIPPSPVTDQIQLDVRGAVWNETNTVRKYSLAVYLDKEESANQLHQETLEVSPHQAAGLRFRWSTTCHAGQHRIILVAQAGQQTWRLERALEILPSDAPSPRRLGGAWVDLYHHDSAEGKPFDEALGQMTDTQWRELVRAMRAVDQNLLVITMMFQNFTHRGRHRMDTEGYQGKAYYPSRLFPGRMPIACPDPLEAILTEADKLGMQVMPGVGRYAFFDYTPGSLVWHKQVAAELWERYGHHPSFYGWYVSGEKDGGLGSAEERLELAAFFREFTSFVRALAPDKPVLLAPNCFHLTGAEAAYRQLLPHLDIICPFGFHRMPPNDLPGEQAAQLMQSLCDEAGCHLWMDLESFVFRNGSELHPRPIEGLISDFTRFPGFEKTLHYQFPGLMSSSAMSRQPGGPASVKLYQDYARFLNSPVNPVSSADRSGVTPPLAPKQP